jgi:hypothetical protein
MHLAPPSNTLMRARKSLITCEVPSLDSAVVKLIDALARAQAKEDHELENSSAPAIGNA